MAAGVYAARKRLKTIFITETIGGQSMDSTEIQNWIGTQKISGLELAKSFEVHLKAYAADIVDIKLGVRVDMVQKTASSFMVYTDKNTFEVLAVLVASARRSRV